MWITNTTSCAFIDSYTLPYFTRLSQTKKRCKISTKIGGICPNGAKFLPKQGEFAQTVQNFYQNRGNYFFNFSNISKKYNIGLYIFTNKHIFALSVIPKRCKISTKTGGI